jgi:1,4-dihydroxy-6-naphthoate synthase
MLLRLGFSPDSDDIFMFFPVLNGLIDTKGYRFEHVRADTETLNQRAQSADLDVAAISIGAYPQVAKDYLLLPHGGSVGRGYGPVVVAPRPMSIESLAGKSIAIPGPGTTAYLVLRLLIPEFRPVFIPIEPYDRVFQALRTGEVDAALLIHEGRLTYEREGFARILDIGEGWSALTSGLPLPLGGNAIRRGLGDRVVREVSEMLRDGIRYALANREKLMDELLRAETRRSVGLERALLDRYLAMYANDDTLGYPDDARRAVDELYARGLAKGLLPESARADWAP